MLNPILAKHSVSSPYGKRARGFHKGIDLAAKRGTAVHAAAGGRVVKAGWSNGYGNLIVIDHGGSTTTRYAHLQNFVVRKGNRVVPGQPIGLVGSTGNASGPHLHFEVLQRGRQVNPAKYVRFGRSLQRAVPYPVTPALPIPQVPEKGPVIGRPAPGTGS